MERTDHDLLLTLDGDLRVVTAELRSLHKVVDERFQARDKALDVVAQETRRAQAQANEWRGALSDLSATKVDAQQFESRIKAIEDKIDLLRDEVTATRGESSGIERSRAIVFAVIGALIGGSGLAIAIALALTQ